MKNKKDLRKSMIASIKIAQKDLGMDDEAYRCLLFAVTGEVTSTKCSVKQLGEMLDELRKKGWRPKPRKTLQSDDLAPLRKKIAAQLFALGKTNDYANTIIDRQTNGEASLKTANREQLTACVAALTNRQKKVMANANA